MVEESDPVKNKFTYGVSEHTVSKQNEDCRIIKSAGAENKRIEHDEKEHSLAVRPIRDSTDVVTNTVLQSIPPESQVTSAKFEGPNIALYTRNPKFSLTELTYHLSSLSKTLKKRFVIRTDPSIRLPEDETRSVVVKLLPKDIVVSAVFCDDATGEVVLEVNRPEIIDADMVVKIAQSTGWIAHTRRSPHIPSNSISTIHSTLKNSGKERISFLQELGNRIFRPPLIIADKVANGSSERNVHNQQGTRYVESSSTTQHSWPINREEVMLFCLGGV